MPIKNTNKPFVIGGKQLAILRIVFRQKGKAYGINIQETLNADEGKETQLPLIYSSLKKLLDKGLVESEMGEATAERGGRRKRLYTITGDGMEALNSSNLADLRSGEKPTGWAPLPGNELEA